MGIDHNYSLSGSFEKFAKFKNRGGIISVSHDVYVLKECEKNILVSFNSRKISAKYFKIVLDGKRSCMLQTFTALNCEDSGILDSHKLNLIESICKVYMNVRVHSSLKRINNQKISKRKVLTKVLKKS